MSISRVISWVEGKQSQYLSRDAGGFEKARSTTKESCYYRWWMLDLLE
jgi:hypothetical protein